MSNQKKLYGVMYCFIAVLWVYSSSFAKEPLIAATCDFEPYFGEKLEKNGPITEITVAAFKEAGYDVTVNFFPWARVMKEAKESRFDVLIGVWHNKDREKLMAFTDPMVDNEIGFYKRKGDSITFTGYQDLKSHRIKVGNVRGYATPKGFDEAGLNVDLVKDDLTNIKKLVKGRLQLILIDKQVGMHLIKIDMPDRMDEIEWLVTLEAMPLMNGIIKPNKKNWQTILNDFNKGLSILKSKGVVTDILKKHGFNL